MKKKEVIIDPDLDQRKLEGYYFETAFCRNCEEEIDFMIPKGKSLNTVNWYECPNCGCKALKP